MMHTTLSARLFALYTTLAAHFAHEPHWWPLWSQRPQFEVMVGAVLVQQTRWEAVEGAVQRLIAQGWLSPQALAEAGTGELAALIRPCAFHTQKAPGLQAISRHLLAHYGGDPAALFAQERQALRQELLALPRIGRETADTMMLYASDHPVFIVDAYARRLFARVDVFPGYDFLRRPYDEVQALVEAATADCGLRIADLSGRSAIHLFHWRFHALITVACIHHCLTKPRCDLPGARRRFLDPRKCAEHCLACGGCPLRGVCNAYQEQRTKNKE
ncbi:MAG: DNA repair protein [Roseiflexaceae bacterium]|nr:DNA repair protein [Roseiflexaceae bacterium]